MLHPSPRQCVLVWFEFIGEDSMNISVIGTNHVLETGMDALSRRALALSARSSSVYCNRCPNNVARRNRK